MNHIEKYSDRELIEMQEIAKDFFIHCHAKYSTNNLKNILGIALVEINRVLDERKIRKEGR